MKNMTVFYMLNEEGQKTELLQGNSGQQLQKIEIPITKDLLNLPSVKELLNLSFTKVTANGDIVTLIGFTLTNNNDDCNYALLKGDSSNYNIKPIVLEKYISYKSSGEPYIHYKESIYKFNSKQSVEDLYSWESKRIKALENTQINQLLEIEREKYNLEIKRKEHEKALKDISNEIASKEHQRDIETKIRKKLQKEEDFIFSKGSPYLRALYEGEYLYLSQYLKELKDCSGLEDFFIDYGYNGSYSVDVIPTTEQLQEVQKLKDKGYNASIVLIESSPVDKDDNYYISVDELPCIGILIPDFEEKANLYKRIE